MPFRFASSGCAPSAAPSCPASSAPATLRQPPATKQIPRPALNACPIRKRATRIGPLMNRKLLEPPSTGLATQNHLEGQRIDHYVTKSPPKNDLFSFLCNTCNLKRKISTIRQVYEKGTRACAFRRYEFKATNTINPIESIRGTKKLKSNPLCILSTITSRKHATNTESFKKLGVFSTFLHNSP
uniref:Uncharacterized protein n=1 Tax=Physcomitrium patens TaxID=3218 RepID=A0A2K1J3U2_PHYPA|nr:hypothetical protein PHYPA_022056 [Physcomitrium patens]